MFSDLITQRFQQFALCEVSHDHISHYRSHPITFSQNASLVLKDSFTNLGVPDKCLYHEGHIYNLISCNSIQSEKKMGKQYSQLFWTWKQKFCNGDITCMQFLFWGMESSLTWNQSCSTNRISIITDVDSALFSLILYTKMTLVRQTCTISSRFFISLVHSGTYLFGITGWYRDQTGILNMNQKR